MRTLKVLRAKNMPLEAVLTPKSGSRFLMNLMYYAETDDFYPEPKDITNTDQLRWAKSKPLRQGQKTIRVSLIRHPVNRFTAFYFENIYFGQEDEWRNWQHRLRDMGFDFKAENNASQHNKNAQLLLELIEEKIDRHGLYSVSEKFAPQVKFLLPAQDFGFQAIVFGRANIELAQRLEPHMEQAEYVTSKIMEDLRVNWPLPPREFITGSLEKRLQELYAVDFDFFEAIRYGTS